MGMMYLFAERKRRRKRRSRYNPMMWKRARRARMAVEVNTGDRSGVITLNPTSVQILTHSDSEEDTIVGDRLGEITLTPKSLTQTSTKRLVDWRLM